MSWSFLKPESLESACLHHGLVLIETLQNWRQQDSPKPFPTLVLNHLSAFDESRWIEMIAHQPGLPEIYPLGSFLHPSPAALSPGGRILADKQFASILRDGPSLVVGLMDPFQTTEVIAQIRSHFPTQHFVLVTLTPPDFARFVDRLDNPEPQTSLQTEEDLSEWCRWLRLPASTFPHPENLVDRLWSQSPPLPVVTPGSHTSAESIPTEPNCLVLKKTATQSWVASLEPNNEALHDRLQQKLARRIHMLAISPREFARLAQLAALPPPQASPLAVQGINRVIRDWHQETGPSWSELQLVPTLLDSAIRRGASDIHLEPKSDHLQIRFRIDGELVIQSPLPKHLYPSLLRRVKILSGMRQELTGVVQDGALTHVVDQIRHDCRTSITILQGGEEALVVRIFSSNLPSLQDLRFPPLEFQTLTDVLQQENGLILVTGPTGSGKTTTLYACLQALSQPSRSIVTIEQPVERHFAAAKQINLGSSDLPSALTFSSALRSLLRQDPDIIMIGEIRDSDSAQIAVQAALTGHLVLSTIHANDSIGVIERLCGSFGVERLALAYTLKLSLAQRLIPRLCPECRRTRAASSDELRTLPKIELENPVIAARMGCSRCGGTGRAGRIPILEMLPIDETTISLMENRASPREIREFNQRRGFLSLQHQVISLVLQGEIEPTELRSFIWRPGQAPSY